MHPYLMPAPAHEHQAALLHDADTARIVRRAAADRKVTRVAPDPDAKPGGQSPRWGVLSRRLAAGRRSHKPGTAAIGR